MHLGGSAQLHLPDAADVLEPAEDAFDAGPRVEDHRALDRAVDSAYGRKSFTRDAERVAFLFEQCQKLTSLLPTEKATKAKRWKSETFRSRRTTFGTSQPPLHAPTKLCESPATSLVNGPS